MTPAPIQFGGHNSPQETLQVEECNLYLPVYYIFPYFYLSPKVNFPLGVNGSLLLLGSKKASSRQMWSLSKGRRNIMANSVESSTHVTVSVFTNKRAIEQFEKNFNPNVVVLGPE